MSHLLAAFGDGVHRLDLFARNPSIISVALLSASAV
jgi:hypothetical protein